MLPLTHGFSRDLHLEQTVHSTRYNCLHVDLSVLVMPVIFYFPTWKERFRVVTLENKENKIKIPSNQLGDTKILMPWQPTHHHCRSWASIELCIAEVMRTYFHCWKKIKLYRQQWDTRAKFHKSTLEFKHFLPSIFWQYLENQRLYTFKRNLGWLTEIVRSPKHLVDTEFLLKYLNWLILFSEVA